MRKFVLVFIITMLMVSAGFIALLEISREKKYYIVNEDFCPNNAEILARYADGTVLIKTYDNYPFKTPNYVLGFDSGKYVPEKLPKVNIGKYFIVQFAGPIKAEWRKTLLDNGFKIYEYIPNYAYLVKGNYRKIREIFKNPDIIKGVYPYLPKFKYDHSVLRNKPNEDSWYIVELFNKNAYRKVSKIVKNFEILGNGKLLKIKISDENSLKKIAEIDDVKGISIYARNKLYNNFISSYFLRTRDAWNTWRSSLPENLNGSAVVVVVLDTGISNASSDADKNNATKIHWDFFSQYTDLYANGGQPTGNSRILAIRDVAGDGDTGDWYSGHGTHVSGMILGNGFMSGSDPMSNTYYHSFAGGAPQAKLIMQAAEDGNNPDSISFDGVGGTFLDALNDAQTTADNLGVVFNIHSNSWGAAVDGDYYTHSHDADAFVWNHTWVLITVSAGNEGPGNQTVGSPATGKDVLAIGAAENYRPAHDYVSGATPMYVVDFSSRGPALDGRIKPDVVGVGTWDISTRAMGAQDGLYGPYDLNKYYEYCSGTSQSNPSVAGAAAIVYDYFIKIEHLSPSQVSSALVKAMLINGARDLGYGIPSYVQGWGMVDIENTLFPKPPRSFKWWQNTSGIQTGNTNITYINIVGSDEPLKITLCWVDPAGNTYANPSLVNDLDLKVTDPSGNVYYGNYFSNSWAVPNPTGTNPWSKDSDQDDDLNNVECVYVRNPKPGKWKIEVIGENVPGNSVAGSDKQSFALVVSGNLGKKDYDMRLTWNYKGKNVTFDKIYDYVYPGQSTKFEFNVTNYGNKDDSYILSVVSPSDVTVILDKTKVSVPAGGYASIVANIKPRNSLDPGLRDVIIKATSENVSYLQDSITIILNIQGNYSYIPQKITDTTTSEYYPAIAQDKTDPNKIFMAYLAKDSTDVIHVYLIYSTDGGVTWSAPIQVSTSSTKYKDDLTISYDGRYVAIAWHEKDAIYKEVVDTDGQGTDVYWNMNREWIAVRIFDAQTNSFTSGVYRIKKEERWVYDSDGILYDYMYDYNYMGISPTVAIQHNRVWLFYQYIYIYSKYEWSIFTREWELVDRQIYIYVNSTYSDDYGNTWSSESSITGQVTNDANHNVDRGYHPYAFVDSSGKLWLFYYKLDTEVNRRDIYYRTYTDSWSSETALETYSEGGNYQDVYPYAFEDSYGKIWVVWWSNRTSTYSPVVKYYDGTSWSSTIVPFSSIEPKPVIDMYNNYYSVMRIPYMIEDSAGTFWFPYPTAERYSSSGMAQLYALFSEDNFTTVNTMKLTESYYSSTWPAMYINGSNVVFVFPQADADWRTDLVKIEITKYFELTLQSGWNLISNPLYNDNMYASMLDSFLKSGDIISIYDPATGYTDRLVGVDDSPNYRIPWYSGIWIYNSASATKTIKLYGIVYRGTVRVDLRKGWNLIGWLNFSAIKASELANYVIGGNVTLISIWNASAQQYEDYLPGISPPSYDFYIYPGMGFWIYVDADCYLEYQT